jgi:hypothetical protein
VSTLSFRRGSRDGGASGLEAPTIDQPGTTGNNDSPKQLFAQLLAARDIDATRRRERRDVASHFPVGPCIFAFLAAACRCSSERSATNCATFSIADPSLCKQLPRSFPTTPLASTHHSRTTCRASVSDSRVAAARPINHCSALSATRLADRLHPCSARPTQAHPAAARRCLVEAQPQAHQTPSAAALRTHLQASPPAVFSAELELHQARQPRPRLEAAVSVNRAAVQRSLPCLEAEAVLLGVLRAARRLQRLALVLAPQAVCVLHEHSSRRLANKEQQHLHRPLHPPRTRRPSCPRRLLLALLLGPICLVARTRKRAQALRVARHYSAHKRLRQAALRKLAQACLVVASLKLVQRANLAHLSLAQSQPRLLPLRRLVSSAVQLQANL